MGSVARDRRKSGGRFTPKQGAISSPNPQPPKPRRRLTPPPRIGPFERPDPNAPLGQVGRRPSAPAKLVLFAVVYAACGVVALIVLKGTLRVVLGVVFLGVALLWLRGASTAFLRQQQRR